MPTYSAVRRNRPQGSVRNPECVATPAMARGCSACSNSARIPPSTSTGSACSRHVTESGPNKPATSAEDIDLLAPTDNNELADLGQALQRLRHRAGGVTA